MTIRLRPLAQLDPDQVEQNLTEILQRIQEDNPHLDVRRGVFAELLAYYHAVLETQRQASIQDYWLARSLRALEADPLLADPDLVDDVLSNYRLRRKPGSRARGHVTIILRDDVTVTIAAGSVFEAQGKRFLATRVFSAKVEESSINEPGDRLLSPTGDGHFAFTIEVEAEEEGEEYEIKKDTLVVPLSPPTAYVTSFASQDFQGGRRAETNQELLLRLQEGIAAKGLAGRVHMSATLRDVEAFAHIVHLSVVGYGDPEMRRDRHWIFPVAGGGRVDWYVRSQEQVHRQLLVKEAVLVEKRPDGSGIWQFSIGRDEAPGYYEVGNIRPRRSAPAAGGFPLVRDTRVADLTGPGFIPDVLPDSVEWVYSRYQAGTVQFHDTETDTSSLDLGARKEYELEARLMPLLADIQDYFSTREQRPATHDLLVKAPVPCFVQLHFTIHKRSGEPDPDLDRIRDALATEINRIGFIGRLDASRLQDVVHAYLRNDQTVSAIDMLGRIRYPDSSVRYLRSSERLDVPDEPASMVSARTVQFFISPEDIGISVAATVPSDM
jgi:hypothetical protein